jgi:hypothetical protein
MLFSLVCVTALLASPVLAFNVDVRSHVEFSQQSGSLFGFSVAAHKEGDTGW